MLFCVINHCWVWFWVWFKRLIYTLSKFPLPKKNEKKKITIIESISRHHGKWNYTLMKNQRKDVQIVSSAESRDLWKMICLKSEAQYVFRDKLERPYPPDFDKIHAFCVINHCRVWFWVWYKRLNYTFLQSPINEKM